MTNTEKDGKLIWFILDEIAVKHSAEHSGSGNKPCSICDRAIEAMKLIQNKPSPTECQIIYQSRES